MTATTAAAKRTTKATDPETPAEPEVEEIAPNGRDLAEILPLPGHVVICNVQCEIRHLKAREFFALMNIMTDVFGTQLMEMGFQQSDSPDAFAQVIAGAFFTAIPRDADKFFDLCQMLVQPVGTEEERDRVKEELADPEIGTMLDIFDQLIENEKDNVWELLGKAKAYLAKWRETFSKTAKLHARSTSKK